MHFKTSNFSRVVGSGLGWIQYKGCLALAFGLFLVCLGGAQGDDYAIFLDGNGDYIDVGKTATEMGLSGDVPRTVTAWLYTQGFNGAGPYDWGTTGSCGQDFNIRTIGENRWRIEYYCTYYDVDILTRERWVHFAHVYENGVTKYYVNGRLLVTWSHGALNTTDTNTLKFGFWPTIYFPGMLDDIRIFNRALTDAEVETVVLNGDVADGLVGHWDFNDGQGTTATDLASGWNGTLVGDSAWVESLLMTQIQPDLMIRTDNELAYTGDDIFDDLPAQTRTQVIGPGLTAIYDIRLQNERPAADAILLQADPGDGQWQVRYLLTGTGEDITDAVTADGWLTGFMETGQVIELSLQITAPLAAPDEEINPIVLTAISLSDGSRLDQVKAETTYSAQFMANLHKTYTLNEDFDLGTLTGVEHETVPDQLQLASESTTLPFIWVPNSNESTISKIDTRTGRELGRYRICPSNLYGNSSRTTVDLYGNCWVGNRRIGTAVKVGLLENGQFVDRNQNGTIETSRDVNGDGIISGGELLPWGSDECVLFEVVVIPGREGTYIPGQFTHIGTNPNDLYANNDWRPGPRGIAIDADNNVWVGINNENTNPRYYYYIEGQTGQILKKIDISSVSHKAYGAVVDQNGILWSSGQDTNNVLRIDPSDDSFTVIPVPHYVYGMGLDRFGHLYISGWQDTRLTRIDIATGTIDWTITGKYQSRGVACTDDGDIWTANTGLGNVTRWTIDKDTDTAVHVIDIPVGDSPTGVSVDAEGKVWVVNLNDAYVKRIDPETNTVDLEKLLPGTQHYGYSDMTGIIARSATTQVGSWRVFHNTYETDTLWGVIGWNADVPAGTSLTVRARSSNDRRNWSLWEEVLNRSPMRRTPPGRYLEVEAIFQTFTLYSPVLYDVTLHALPACGDFEHPFPVGDLTYDCRVNLLDLRLFAENWLVCVDVDCD
ncbi:MAG: hypothetical protein JW828_00010 [Sedimentisphaerales bacterium]|nr:hypothetical protein [Sedimentisphaerales bacterium]